MGRLEWYTNNDSMLDELRRARAERFATPAIAGYGEFEEISRGGQGVVFSAIRSRDGRRVAIKVLADGVLASEDRRRRFEREVELAAGLRHDNVVHVPDHGVTSEGLPFLVMDFVDGAPFDVFARAQRESGDGAVRRILAAFLQVCAAVQFAHQRGVIHRDLKPGNILVDAHGVAHVLDFGLAKALTEPLADLTSVSGRFVGSLPWSSPEQAEGRAATVDVRSDVYSLGVLLYEALTGAMPYDVHDVGLRAALERVASAAPERPARHGVRGDIETVLLRCLEKAPDRRYQSVAELEQDVRRVMLGQPIEVRRDSARRAMQRALRRYRAGVAVAGVLIVGLSAFGVAAAMLYTRARDAETLAATRLQDVTAEAARTNAVNTVLERVLDAVVLDDAATSLAAVGLLEEAAASYEQSADHDIAVEARMRFAIGHAYATMARFDDAEPHLRRALALSREAFGDSHPEVAACMARLGDVMAHRALPASTTLQQEALRIRRSHYGSEHVEVARSLGGLAYASWIAGDDDAAAQADRLYAEAIELYERLGDQERELARCLHGYAAMCEAQGRRQEAYEVYLRALRLFNESDREDPYRLECMASAAGFFATVRDSWRAERLYLMLAEDAPRIFGESVRPRFLWRAGSMRVDQDDPDGAEELFRRAIVAECRVVAGAQPDLGRELRRVADELERSDLTSSNVRPYREAMSLLFEAAGGARPNDCVVLRELGLSLLSLGRASEAETVLRTSHGVAVSIAGDDAPPLTQCKGALGICLARLGMFEEAETLLLKSYELGRSPTHEDRRHERLALTRLIELYTMWRRPEDAARFSELLDSLGS